MQTITQEQLDITILKTGSPVQRPGAWQIESFCTRTFEYFDYSLRKALAGSLDSRLQCTFFLAQNDDRILAAAGCLHSEDNPSVAILGPVCTDPQYRKMGLSFQVCSMLLDHLKAKKIQAVYLGVKGNVPAINLYKKLGFIRHSGIVMRKLFAIADEFNNRYSAGQETIIRQINWSDFAEVSALLCEPAKIVSFDFCQQLFSSKYAQVQRFLPVFPTLMNDLEKNCGFGAVLQTTENKSIVGTAFIKPSLSALQYYIATLEFFVLDGFTDKAVELVSQTMKQSGFSGNRTILCYCPECDIYKKQILLMLGAEPYAVLPDFVRIKNKLHKTIVYQFTREL